METDSHLAKSAAGAALFGLDSGRWPAWWLDAVTAIERARIAEHNARVMAEMKS